MALSLPSNPNLERFRRDARALQRAVRARDPRSAALVAQHHPHGAAVATEGFALSDAQLVVARSYGLASWPQLREYLRLSAPLRRDPTSLEGAADDPEADPAAAVAVLACLQYTDRDEPARWARAASLLARHPELAARDVVVAAVAGDAVALGGHLAADNVAATRPGGPFGWPPLLYVVYSRMPQGDAVASARLLLDAGADPDSGYLWQGQPTAFTALSGAFGEGEGGPGRQPRHARWRELAVLLLERGADPNDRQALYNRMFGRDDSHLELLLEHGLGHPSSDVWARRTGVQAETLDEMVSRQLHWAHQHGYTGRLALLADHGLGPAPDGSAPRPGAAPIGHLDDVDRPEHVDDLEHPDIHRAGTPDAVRSAVAAGADVDAVRDGRTALHRAALLGDVEMLTALLDAGADPAVVDRMYGTTPLGWARWGRNDAAAGLLRDTDDTGDIVSRTPDGERD